MLNIILSKIHLWYRFQMRFKKMLGRDYNKIFVTLARRLDLDATSTNSPI